MREGTVISCNIFQTFFILYSPVSTDGKQMLPLSRDFKPVMWIRIDCNADPHPDADPGVNMNIVQISLPSL